MTTSRVPNHRRHEQQQQQRYEQGPYEQGPYEQQTRPYEQGTYRQGPYEQGPYEQQTRPYEQGTYRQGPYEQGTYEQQQRYEQQGRYEQQQRYEQQGRYMQKPYKRRRRFDRRYLFGLAVLAVVVAAGIVYVVRPSSSSSPSSTSTLPSSLTPAAGASYAGSLVLNATGAQLASWNQTSSECTSQSIGRADGTVATDSSGDATMTTTGKPGSCAAIISPNTYSSNVIEARIDFPAIPGKSNTIANWTALWMTNQAAWPVDGELDAVETEPVTGVNAVSWHSGASSSSVFVASTDGFQQAKLPIQAPNLTPGWHTVDIVYTKGFFAVYYDGRQYTSYTSSKITGSALNIIFNTTVTPKTYAAYQIIGGTEKNSDSSPATIAVQYLKIWSYK
jgi:hypothetical protein